MTSFAVVGREGEFASIHAFVGRTEPTATALVLEGEAGIGKSTLWLAGVEYARSHGFGVLLSRPAEPERELAHAGLGDLLDGLTEEVLHELAAPRRQALEAALLLGEGSGAPVDPHALAVAVRDVLHVLGERQPLLVAVDDVQWLDRPSSNAVAFALRLRAHRRPARVDTRGTRARSRRRHDVTRFARTRWRCAC